MIHFRHCNLNAMIYFYWSIGHEYLSVSNFSCQLIGCRGLGPSNTANNRRQESYKFGCMLLILSIIWASRLVAKQRLWRTIKTDYSAEVILKTSVRPSLNWQAPVVSPSRLLLVGLGRSGTYTDGLHLASPTYAPISYILTIEAA